MEITKVYFINLEKRKDRLEHIENVLFNKLNFPKEKVERIEGVIVPNENGSVGCASSHIKILNKILREKQEVVLILEDDFDVYDPKLFWDYINEFNLNEWDLIQVSANLIEYQDSRLERLVKVVESQTTSGYIINIKFVNKLLRCFRESKRELINTKDTMWAIDQNWKKLQKKSKWYCFNPRLGFQINGFSDIENKIVDYKC